MTGPYRLRSWLRTQLPWRLIGLAPKGRDCEAASGTHEWYNHDGSSLACYHCLAVRPAVREVDVDGSERIAFDFALPQE